MGYPPQPVVDPRQLLVYAAVAAVQYLVRSCFERAQQR